MQERNVRIPLASVLGILTVTQEIQRTKEYFVEDILGDPICFRFNGLE